MHDSRPGQFKCHQKDDSIIFKYVSIEVPNGVGHSIFYVAWNICSPNILESDIYFLVCVL